MEFLDRTWAEININALIHNFNLIKSKAGGAKVMAVVKADAYGHTAEIVAPTLQAEGADYFAVSNLNEAVSLRKLGIVKPIFILGYTPVHFAAELAAQGIIQTVYSKDYAVKLSEEAQKANVCIPVHIKLDTGMGRLGFNAKTEEFIDFDVVSSLFSLKGLKVEGMFTHLPAADSKKADDIAYTKQQIVYLNNAKKRLESAGHKVGILHFANSAGFLSCTTEGSDICRPGIILYGLSPSADVALEGLIPVMSLKSVVSMVKTVQAGEYISYSRTFQAKTEMKVATVTAGYADGVPRALSNKGEVIICGKRAPIIGTICMDQFLVDVSEIDDVQIGQEVILFGPELSVDELAEKAGTINYEIICGITQRVPRVIIK